MRQVQNTKQALDWLNAGDRAKRCIQCGKPFVDKHPRNETKFCSHRCRWHKNYVDRYRARVGVKNKVCPHCSRSFETTSTHKIYCCTLHEVLHYQKKKRVRSTYDSRPCAGCGTEFYPRNRNAGFCGQTCYKIHWQKMRRCKDEQV